MSVGLAQQDRSYRRGLVLGLTMAEIVVLIIFALLLALAADLAVREERIRVLERLAVDAAPARQALAALQEQFPQAQNFDDLFIELKVAVEQAKSLGQSQQQLAVAVAKAKEAEKNARMAKAVEQQFPKARTPEELMVELRQVLEQAHQQAETRKELESAKAELQEAAADAGLGRDLREAAKAAGKEPRDMVAIASAAVRDGDPRVREGELQREVATLKGQLVNLRGKLAAVGKGTEMPACWASPETGRPEYIFDIALKSAAFVIRDRKLPHRVADQAVLPLQGMVFDQDMAPRAFETQTDALYRWSVKHECRFFVRAFDLTGPTEKDVYKRQMRSVDARFYKLEVLNEPFN
jgi:hypothetical protein